MQKKLLARGRMFDVVEAEITFPDNRVLTRVIVEHPGAVIIIPVDQNGDLLLVNQFRHSINSTLLEFPAGTLEKNEDPLECAKRELQEEVGMSAVTWQSLGTIYPAPGFCSEKQYCYLASELSPVAQKFDEDEIIEVVKYTKDDFTKAIKNGTIIDGKTLALYALAYTRGLL